MNLALGGIGTALVLFVCSTVHAQMYPRWFLFPDEIPCGTFAIGMAPTPYYPDSSGGEAFLSGVVNAVRSDELTIEGTKEYGATDVGVTAISTDVQEIIDSAKIDLFAKSLKLLDLRTIGETTLALVGHADCQFPDSLKNAKRPSRRSPAWLASLPQDSQYYYAVGMSEPAYYEFSAWLEAEKHARLELAKSVRSTVRGVDRMEAGASGDEAYSSVQDEKISITLRGVQVARRWKDPKTRLYAVLLRIPR